MPFNSLKYLLFLPFVYLVFYFAGQRSRWIVLLVASIGFYAALKAPYLPAVLALVTVMTYGFGIWLHHAPSPRMRIAIVWSGIAGNILILIGMKYLPFIGENLKAVAPTLFADIHHPHPLVAIGVSYYAFQATSYLFDIYLGIEKPERHLGFFALYLAFFPKLLQGPIERGGDLIPQLKEPYRFSYQNMRSGFLMFAWGLFKKIVIADRLGLYVDHVYNDVHAFTGLPLLLATYAYAFQIYMDFSGYTDMARGSARLFNIDLTENFNHPYGATSVAEFWRRWHITLSRCILDYVFTPLQMLWRNGKRWGSAAALFAAFLVSGLWHGASWKFVAWGALHGLYLACSLFYKPYQKKFHRALNLKKTRLLKAWQVFVTFNLVSFAWIFFRASDMDQAVYIVTEMFRSIGGIRSLLLSQGEGELAIVLVLLVPALTVSATRFAALLEHRPYRHLVYYCLVLVLLLCGKYQQTGFLYFGF